MSDYVVAWDSFARSGLRRLSVGAGECDACGQQRRRLYSYDPVQDSSRGWKPCGLPAAKVWKVCNLSCLESMR